MPVAAATRASIMIFSILVLLSGAIEYTKTGSYVSLQNSPGFPNMAALF
jgi:hypothetical protein